MTAHYVYRYYDGNGALLYVGCTHDPASRDGAHARAAGWYKFAVDRTVSEPMERSAALASEAEAIDNESPRFNVRRGTKPASMSQPAHPLAVEVQRRMDDLGVTSFSLAKRCGIPAVTFQRSMTTGNFRLDHLFSICKALGLDVSDLLRQSETAADAEAVA